MPEFTVSLTHLLTLRDEKHVMEEGHEFLDEKCSLLGATLVQQLKRYQVQKAELRKQLAAADELLQAATMLRGLEALQCAELPALPEQRVERETRNLLGVQLLQINVLSKPVRQDKSSLEDQVALGFSELIGAGAELAATRGNLARLFADYRKTERRARSLEEVLIPELGEQTRRIESALEAQEMEEAVSYRKGR